MVPLQRRRLILGQQGSAVVDFALTGGLLSLLFLGAMQLAVVLHVRNTVIDCAAEGARYGARANGAAGAGAERARVLLVQRLSADYEQRATSVDRVVTHDGIEVIQVEIVAPLPIIGLIGPTHSLRVSGHAYAERQ
ncbi:MAG: TadE/TadG family type IV pilus assembly protein [Actinomycetota bacterium]